MWSREILKNEAKETLQNCHGSSILICLLSVAVSNAVNSIFSRRITFNINDPMAFWEQYSIMLRWATISNLISALIQIFLINLLAIGMAYFFLSSRIRPSGVSLIGYAFRNGRYGNACKVMFLTHLFIALWSLLFVIPGIYKSYQYRMVPYLLAENPEMDYQRALSLSTAMMDGEKLNAFVLDLSFIGWYLLSIFTCMILAVLYVIPYQEHTNAGLYILLREKAINNGLVNPAELYAVVNDVQ